MERADVEALGQELLEKFVANPPEEIENIAVRVTSGTSSGAPLVIPTAIHPDAPADMEGREITRILTCSGSLGARLANALVVSKTRGSYAMRVLSVDPGDLQSGIEALLADYAPSAIYGFPSYLRRVAEYIPARTVSGVRRITLTGEALSESLEEYLAARFPNAQIAEQYMATEAGGYLGNRFCPHLKRGQFHPAKGTALEVEHAEDGVGDIIVSKEIFPGARIERYRIGDIGQQLPEACACGESIFEILGRRGADYVKLDGALLRREEFDRVLARFRDLVDDWRVEAYTATGDAPARVELLIWRKKGAGTDALAREIAEAISRALFVSPTRTFADLVQKGALAPLHARFSDQPFSQGIKDVKLRLRRA